MAKCHESEMDFMYINYVWTLVDVPQGIMPIGTISIQGRHTWMATYQRTKLGL